ncbi:MAG: DUF420 domain-containing protein [Magnetococcus sp. MYC-9]
MNGISLLPHVQAALNLASLLCLLAAYRAIRRHDTVSHRKYMLAAVGIGALFLVCYATYHATVGNVQFAGTGWVRPLYFAVLISHVTLAALLLPLCFLAIRRAPWGNPSGDSTRHRRIARWAWPIWLYVSLSGLIIYTLAFHRYPAT